MSKHTPGPWKIEYSDTSTRPDLKIKGNMLVATTPPLHSDREINEEVKANARLIAAAPDLLAAAKAALSLLTDDGYQGGNEWTVKVLRATIAKAERRANNYD